MAGTFGDGTFGSGTFADATAGQGVAVTITGQAAAASVAAPSGSASASRAASVSGQVATSTAAARQGAVSGSRAGAVTGAPAQALASAGQGAVSATASATVQAPAGALSMQTLDGEVTGSSAPSQEPRTLGGNFEQAPYGFWGIDQIWQPFTLSQDDLVTNLGVWVGDQGSLPAGTLIGFTDETRQGLLASATLQDAAPAGTLAVVDLGDGLQLTAGTTYCVYVGPPEGDTGTPGDGRGAYYLAGPGGTAPFGEVDSVGPMYGGNLGQSSYQFPYNSAGFQLVQEYRAPAAPMPPVPGPVARLFATALPGIAGLYNDPIAKAYALTGAGSISGTNVDYTLEADEPDGGNPIGHTAWFTWSPDPALDGASVTFDTFGSDFDTILNIYTGGVLGQSDFTGLSLVAGNDDAGGDSQSQVSFTAVAGALYHVQVGGYNQRKGNYVLNYPASSGGGGGGGTGEPTGTVDGSTVNGPYVRLSAAAPAGDIEAFAIDRTADRLTLTLVSDQVATQPGLLRLSLGNGEPGADAYLFLDGELVAQVLLDDNGVLITYDLGIDGLAVGTHTVAASRQSDLPGDPTLFDVLSESASAEVEPTPVLPALPVTTRWVLQSYHRVPEDHISPPGTTVQDGFETYVFPINPDKVSRHFGDLAVAEDAVVNGGRVVSWQGAIKPQQWSFSGHVLDRPSYDAIVYWGRENRRVFLTDHHGDRYLLIIGGLSLERVRDLERRWHHTYTVTAYALTGAGVLV